MARLTGRGACTETSSEDDGPRSGAAAALRSIKRRHLNSRSVSPDPASQDILPGLGQTSWFTTSDEPASPEALRQRPAHQHKHSQSDAAAPTVSKIMPPAPQKLRRKDRKSTGLGAAADKSRASAPPVESPTTHELQAKISVPEHRKGSNQHVRRSLPSTSSRSKDDGESSVRISFPTPRKHSSRRRPSSSHGETRHRMMQEPLSPQFPVADHLGPAPPVDPRKMLLLMRKTSGRMQGQLLHKATGEQSWIESRCFIDVESGTLISDDEILGQPRVLFQGLRQCRTQAHLHTDSSTFILHITSKNKRESIQVRPPDQLLFNAWFAALLCWRPIKHGQDPNDRKKSFRPILIRQLSDYLPKVDPGALANPIRKVGNAILVEPDHSRTEFSAQLSGRFMTRTRWSTVSCTLNARGELRLHSKNLDVLVSVLLAELPRSAIQRLGTSVLGADCVIAIYPQYGQNANACSRIRPVYLSFESRELFEVWFVLMRAHAIPELFGASRMQAASETSPTTEFLPGINQSSSPPLFRMENVLRLQIKEAKLQQSLAKGRITPDPNEESPRNSKNKPLPVTHFAEILLDGQVRARSTFKFDTMEPLWWETFTFNDLPNLFTTVTVRVKRQGAVGPDASEEIPISPDARSDDAAQDRADVACGEMHAERSTLEQKPNVEDWFELQDEAGDQTGEIALKIQLKQQVVLMDQEYNAVSGLLHNFPNCLTLQIYERIPDRLNQLAETLLNIFQVSGQAGEWLMFLAEEEIDGVRETAPNRIRFTQRLESTESRESLNTADREDMVRDMGRSATAEANLLFRGNTLLSKALDTHMRRLGRDYLELTLGNQLRTILHQDVDCEVDPARMSGSGSLTKNWTRLIDLTKQTWDLIAASANNCPVELRMIFRHIRACADDRYGDYLRSVPYSSVSGFLFLRFFCAAVLNPQLFLLIDSTPRPRAQRTYILLAKSLQGLANMTTFGHKEPWMSPMNTFLNSHRQAFKRFIDDVCNVTTDAQPPIPASYNIPYIIFQKSPMASREGFPSLPYLIDRAHSLASLVELWLEGVSSTGSDGLAPPGASNKLTGDLARFHDFCLGLHKQTRAAYRSADRAAGTSASPLNHAWSAIAQRMELVPEDFWVKQRGERARGDENRVQASATSPLSRKGTAAGPSRSGSQQPRGQRGGRDEMWRPLAIRRRAGSQPVAGASALKGEDATMQGHDSSDEDEAALEDLGVVAMGRRGEEGGRPGSPSQQSPPPLPPPPPPPVPGLMQGEERSDKDWRHFWRKRGRTPDRRETTA